MTKNGQAADPVTHAFKTEALPTGPAVVSIEEVATTHSSIRFTLKLDNAVRIAYKVDVPNGTAEMTVVEKTAAIDLPGRQPPGGNRLRIDSRSL